jgi:hypothetical protein
MIWAYSAEVLVGYLLAYVVNVVGLSQGRLTSLQIVLVET